MQSGFRAALAVLLSVAVMLDGGVVVAQEPAAPVPAAEPAAPPVAGLPAAPIPYSSTQRPRTQRRRAAPSYRPAAATAPAAAGAAAPGAATADGVAAVAAPAVPGARLAPGTPIPPAELEAFVDGVVRQSMAEDHIAGAAVSIVQNGQVILKKGYGYDRQSPLRPVDPDRTLFRLGSVSKLFTWIGLMQQVERGRMGLANPVNQYLPQRLQVKDQGFTRSISMLDLMNHAAGFEDRVMGQLFERRPERIRPLDVYLRQEIPQRVREAGALPVYSNYGVGLAGEAVSEVARQPFNRLMELEIIRPLALNRTTFREPYPMRNGLPEPMKPDMALDVSEGFHWTGGELHPRSFEYLSQIAPAGSASSTVADMARFMNLILANGQIGGVTLYSPRTAQAFRTVTARPAPGVDGWAHGFRATTLPGGFSGFGHDGETLSFRTNLVTVPDLGLGVFIAANTETATGLTLRLPQLVVERFYGGTRVLPAASPELAQRRASLSGVYMSDRRAYSGLEKFLAVLTGAVTVDVSPDGRLITRSGPQARSWAPLPDGRFQADDGLDVSTFTMADGAAERWFVASGGSYKRVGMLSQASTLKILGVLALLASIGVLVGLVTRDRRDFRQTSIQNRASAVQTATAILWLLAAGGLAMWAASAADVATVVYDWPGPWLLLASACALVAGLLTLIAAILLPGIWKGGRRLDSWTVLRKLRFTLVTALFAALTVVLAMNGALEPWSG